MTSAVVDSLIQLAAAPSERSHWRGPLGSPPGCHLQRKSAWSPSMFGWWPQSTTASDAVCVPCDRSSARRAPPKQPVGARPTARRIAVSRRRPSLGESWLCFCRLRRNPGVRPGVGVVSFPRYGRCEVSRYSFTGSKLGEGVVYFRSTQKAFRACSSSTPSKCCLLCRSEGPLEFLESSDSRRPS